MQRWLIGIDEAGRGPLAGPVAVGVVLVSTDFDWGLLPGVGDSKQLSPTKRETLFQQAKALKQAGRLDYAVSMVSAAIIDKKGIQFAIKNGIERSLNVVLRPRVTLGSADVLIKLDGGLRAPGDFVHQETIIKGDAIEPAIGLASIMAKVTRDQYMVQLGRRPEYNVYDFATHKGYGTKAHRSYIAQYGCSPQHRRSYCKNIINIA
jgi:ribonuclease HII